MTLELQKELLDLAAQNPTHLFTKVLEVVILQNPHGLDKQVYAHLLMAQARIEELNAQEDDPHAQ